MVAMWNKWWAEHGTKILGFASFAVGMLEYIDEQTIKAIEFVAGPHYGAILSHGLVAAAGLLTARRGFINTAKKKLEAADGPH